MKYYWIILVRRGKGYYEVVSAVGFDTQFLAQTNLEAKINQVVPHIEGWKQGDYIASYALELR